jgi:hypothetical protein
MVALFYMGPVVAILDMEVERPVAIRKSGGGSSSSSNVRRLYHATSINNVKSINVSKRMHPGGSGMFGAGIYFASTEADARHKAQTDRAVGDAMVVADVDLGKCYEANTADHSLCLTKVNAAGCNSVHGHLPGRGEEFVVYEPHRVEIVNVLNI